jgi:hypothetical protein
LEEQPATIAALLTAADNGDDTAKDRLFAVLYAELHAMARREGSNTAPPNSRIIATRLQPMSGNY